MNKPKIVSNFFSEQECREIIREAEKFYSTTTFCDASNEKLPFYYMICHRNGKNTFDIEDPLEHSNNRILFNNRLAKRIMSMIREKIPIFTTKYVTILKYAVGLSMGWHYDDDYSLCIYLNKDFEGGELCFARASSIKPETGQLVVFPRVKHCVLPVTSGTRYCISFGTNKKVYDSV